MRPGAGAPDAATSGPLATGTALRVMFDPEIIDPDDSNDSDGSDDSDDSDGSNRVRTRAVRVVVVI